MSSRFVNNYCLCQRGTLLVRNRFFAAIDMGTNSFHLIIVEVLPDGAFRIIDREREVIRLGLSAGKDLSFITDEEIEKAIKILAGFKKLSDFYKAELKAVATSAVREAKNQKEFLESVLNSTGINVEVIDGSREASLIYKGVQRALPVVDRNVLCVDIGGGSSEFIFGEKGSITFAESIKIGAVRLSKKYFTDYVLTNQAIKDCSDYAEEQITKNSGINFNINFEYAVGTSGTMQSAAWMIAHPGKIRNSKSLNSFSFTRDQLTDITKLILSYKTLEERKLIKGIELKRADILPAGLIILNKVFELFSIKSMTISEYALREGIISEMLSSNHKQHLTHNK